MKKISITVISIVLVLFVGYQVLYPSVDLSTKEGTGKAFATALLKQDYDLAGELYPFETSSVGSAISYSLGPLADIAAAPYTLDDLMYAMDGFDKGDIKMYSDDQMVYIVSNFLQEDYHGKLGHYLTDTDMVSVIKLSFERVGSEYYISQARLAYMDASNFYN